MDKINTNQSLQTAVVRLVQCLGVNYYDNPTQWFPWLNSKGWTENDDEAADLVIKYRKSYASMQKMYYEVTNNRDLSADLLDLLDTDSLKRVRKYIKLV